MSRWARCEALGEAWAAMTYRLTRGAIRSGPEGVREVAASAKKGDRRRRLIPRSWAASGLARTVDYPTGHPLRLRSAGAGGSRLVHYVGGFEVGETEGRPHAHLVAALPPGMSPAIFWSAWPHGEVRVDVVRSGVRAIAYAVGYAGKAGLRIGRVRTSGRLPRYLVPAVSSSAPGEVRAVKSEGRAVLMRLARRRDDACKLLDLYGPTRRYPLQPNAPPEDEDGGAGAASGWDAAEARSVEAWARWRSNFRINVIL